MIAPILDRIFYFSLGKPGREFVEMIENHMWLFTILFLVYAGVLLYSKIIWSEYLPRIMMKFLKEEKLNGQPIDEVYMKWLAHRKQLPKYLLVPSHNEFWVKTAANMSGIEKKLFYNSDKKKLTEKECLAVLLNKQ